MGKYKVGYLDIIFILFFRNGQDIQLKGHTAVVRSISFSKDGSFLASSSDDQTVRVWKMSDYRQQFALAGHTNWVRTCHYRSDSY